MRSRASGFIMGQHCNAVNEAATPFAHRFRWAFHISMLHGDKVGGAFLGQSRQAVGPFSGLLGVLGLRDELPCRGQLSEGAPTRKQKLNPKTTNKQTKTHTHTHAREGSPVAGQTDD